MEKNIKFNEQEATALISLLDLAVKASGLQVADNAGYLAKKIKDAFVEKEPAEEKPKEPTKQPKK